MAIMYALAHLKIQGAACCWKQFAICESCVPLDKARAGQRHPNDWRVVFVPGAIHTAMRQGQTGVVEAPGFVEDLPCQITPYRQSKHRTQRRYHNALCSKGRVTVNFVMTAQERSFTRAAERLHITQQTLSAHIANLEREVGSRLFVRSLPLELTYAGQVFWEYAVEFRRKLQALEREMGDIAQDKKGLLRIGIASTRGRTIMPDLIRRFHLEQPLVSVKLIEAPNDRLRQCLTDGEIDLAIANFPQKIPGVEIQDFYQEEIVLLAARSLLERIYGSEASELVSRVEQSGLVPLADCPFLLNCPQDIAGCIGRNLLAQAGVIPKIAVESSNMETLLELCVRGEGACFCPENLMRAVLSQDQLDKLVLFRLGQDVRLVIRFAYLKQEHHWSVLESFIRAAMRT